VQATKTVEDLKRELPKRIKKNEKMMSGAFYLDLRSSKFGDLGRVLLHDPSWPTWPVDGRTTKDEAEAKRWVRDHYAAWLSTHLSVQLTAPDQFALTVEEACERYLKDAIKRKGAEHNTIKNRESQIRLHIVPRFGHCPLTSLAKKEVREWLNNLTVVSHSTKNGSVEAAMNTKRNLRTTMLAIWNFNYPDSDAPFSRIWLDNRDDRPLHKQIVSDEDTLKSFLEPRSGALRMEQVDYLLAAAMWYDQSVLGRSNTRAISVANTAFAIAFYCATGCRLEEGLRARWFMVDEEKGHIIVNSVKNSRDPVRIIPLQYSLIPWLMEARQEQQQRFQEVGPRDLLIQTKPRSGEGERSTLQKRIAKVLRFANLKLPKKAVHGFRATFATQAARRPDLITTEQLKRYLGHTVAYAGATDLYVAQLNEPMAPKHRQLIALPTPDEVRAAAATFTPANRPHWRESARRPETRDPEVRARQAMKKAERLERLRANY
jgi:integrase